MTTLGDGAVTGVGAVHYQPKLSLYISCKDPEMPSNAVVAHADSTGYGLELMVEVGTGCAPCSSEFSDRPMHAPESCPVQGTPLISGTSGLAAVVVNPCGEFGTMNGVHTVVKTSSSSRGSHAARGRNALAAR